MTLRLRLLISGLALGLASPSLAFQKEMACYSKIAGNSLVSPSGAQAYHFARLTGDPGRILGVEERLGSGQVARVYFFTEDGGYTHIVNQTEGYKSYQFRIPIKGVEQQIGFDRIESQQKGYSSLAFVTEPSGAGIRLSLEKGDKLRKILNEALVLRIQSMRSTFDARVKLRRDALMQLRASDPKLQDRSIDLEKYFETLPELTQKKISTKQDPTQYVQQLEDCREALGIESRFDGPRSEIAKEIEKFKSNGALPASTYSVEAGAR